MHACTPLLSCFNNPLRLSLACCRLTNNSPTAYFKDAWNWIDFVVVVESIVFFILEAAHANIDTGGLGALRTLRVLRPLKAASFVPEIKLLFETFLASLRVFMTLIACICFVLLGFGNFA